MSTHVRKEGTRSRLSGGHAGPASATARVWRDACVPYRTPLDHVNKKGIYRPTWQEVWTQGGSGWVTFSNSTTSLEIQLVVLWVRMAMRDVTNVSKPATRAGQQSPSKDRGLVLIFLRTKKPSQEDTPANRPSQLLGGTQVMLPSPINPWQRKRDFLPWFIPFKIPFLVVIRSTPFPRSRSLNKSGSFTRKKRRMDLR